jgi:hypothetical protein
MTVKMNTTMDIALHLRFFASRMSDRDEILIVEMNAARDMPSPCM